MLKIEQFVEQHFGIKLFPAQLEMIAMMAANPEKQFVIQRPSKQAGKTTAYKAAMAYLQDGLTPATSTTAQNTETLIAALASAIHLTPRLQNAIASYLEYQSKPTQIVRRVDIKGINEGMEKQ